MGRYKLTYHGPFLVNAGQLVVEFLCSFIEILGNFSNPPCLVRLSPATQCTTPFVIIIFIRYEPLRVNSYYISFLNTYLVCVSRDFNSLML